MGVSEREKIYILKEILRGLEMLHSLQIVHADLKPANILISTKGKPLISDYGISRILRKDFTFESGTLEATLKYAAPELLLHSVFGFSVNYIKNNCEKFF